MIHTKTRRWHVTISCQPDGRPPQPVRTVNNSGIGILCSKNSTGRLAFPAVAGLLVTNGTLYQSSKTLKTIGVQIVTGLPRLYKQCTNRQQEAQLLLG